MLFYNIYHFILGSFDTGLIWKVQLEQNFTIMCPNLSYEKKKVLKILTTLLVLILKKKNYIKLCCGTEIQCVSAARAQHSDPGVAGRETLQNDSTWSSFTLGEVPLHLAPSTVLTAAAVLQVLSLQPFKPRFCDLGTPWPLGDRRMTVCHCLNLVSCLPLFAVILSPLSGLALLFSLSLSPISLQHTTFTITSHHCRCRQKMHHLPRVVTYLKKLLPANQGDDLQHSGNSTSLRHNMEWVQQ